MYQNFTRPRLKWLILSLVTITTLYVGFNPIAQFFTVLYSVLIEFRFNAGYHQFKIYLWTDRNHPAAVFPIEDVEGFVKSSLFNPTNPVIILFHGFSDTADTLWTRKLKDKYLSNGGYNIISVDWKSSAQSPWYNTAAKNSRLVAKEAASFMRYIVDYYALEWQHIHVLGASLGAHAAGYFGRYTGGKVGRITGLDPSGPLFYTATREDRLDASDALFVDVIHSAGRWIGNDNIQGHVDFFPNGGRAPQPGCVESVDLSCSHFLSWRLYAQSISNSPNDKKFVSVKCASYKEFSQGGCCRSDMDVLEMGERVSRDARGTYFLYTGDSSPFALPPANSTNCHLLK